MQRKLIRDIPKLINDLRKHRPADPLFKDDVLSRCPEYLLQLERRWQQAERWSRQHRPSVGVICNPRYDVVGRSTFQEHSEDWVFSQVRRLCAIRPHIVMWPECGSNDPLTEDSYIEICRHALDGSVTTDEARAMLPPTLALLRVVRGVSQAQSFCGEEWPLHFHVKLLLHMAQMTGSLLKPGEGKRADAKGLHTALQLSNAIGTLRGHVVLVRTIECLRSPPSGTPALIVTGRLDANFIKAHASAFGIAHEEVELQELPEPAES